MEGVQVGSCAIFGFLAEVECIPFASSQSRQVLRVLRRDWLARCRCRQGFRSHSSADRDLHFRAKVVWAFVLYPTIIQALLKALQRAEI